MREALQDQTVFMLVSGAWAIAMIAIFITVIRMCYTIEARSGRPMPKQGLPGFANVFPVAFNIGVAKDEETQRLRWRMNQRLLVILAGFVVFALIVRESGV
ncbi:MAG: hypothetical protein Q8Q62_02105 [Mesorhizobium sp.]|nr:hypothetical protein [Mesorhizobium sp.]